MLPLEHEGQAKGQCGLLDKHMYGTRASSDGWQQECPTFLKSIGCYRRTASPWVLMHAEKGIATSMHGDDFTGAAPKCELDWLKSKLRAK